jgi:hypothetical protein
MQTWHIFAIIVAIGFGVAWFMMRKKTLATASTPISTEIQAAPGVSPSTGQVASNPAPPPPRGVVATIQSNLTPTGLMQHVPVVGNTAARISKAPMTVSLKAADLANNALSHVPVVGKALAAPGKAVTNVAKKILSFW